MKKITFSILFLTFHTLFIYSLFAQELSYTHLRDGKGVSVNLSLKSYDLTPLQYRGEAMQEISVSGIFIPNDEGMPNLPRISKFLAIPKGAEVKVSIKNMETETRHNVNIAPALRVQAIPEEPAMDYVKNSKVYETDAFYPQNVCEISEVTSIRGVDAVIIGITPFQFNPVTKELIVIRDIELEIEYVGVSREYGDAKYRSPWFDPILKTTLLNYDMLPEMEYTAKSARNGEGCEYLIVIPNREDFRPYAEQIKEFRTKQGIYTKIMSLEEMEVTNTTQLKSFFHNAYHTWDIPPVAVLLMADHNTNMSLGIPAEVISHPYSGTCITDNQYADAVGNDKLPEMVFGRMAADNEAQMAVLVSKVLEYETQPCMDPYYYQNPITALGWQTERWFQICSEVVGGYWRSQGKTPVRINAIYQGTPGNVWSTNQNTSSVVNYFGPNGKGFLPATPAELGGWSGGTPAQVVTAINNGAFALQHRDHGSANGWGEPAFNSSHISQFTNAGKMTYLFTINCETGKFNNSTPCFGEVFHRYTYQEQNAGCVGFLGPTEVSYSFVNDAFAWGMYDLFDANFMHDWGYSGSGAGYSGNWMPAFGNVSGKWFLAQSSWPYNTGDKIITYQMFTAHSDVFLRLFTEVPQPLTVSHDNVSLAGNPNFLISANEGALIALTAEIDGNLEILSVATATGNTQTMTIPSTLLPNTEIHVVITGQNYLRYEAIVTVTPAEGPFVIPNGYTVVGNEPILTYISTNTEIEVTLKNVGVETANALTTTISCADPQLTINNATATCGSIAPDGTATVHFNVTVDNAIPNNKSFPVDVTITEPDKSRVWESKITLKAYKPILAYQDITWQGGFTAGETLSLCVLYENKGGARVNNVICTLNTSNPDVTINNNEVPVGTVASNGIGYAVFSITLSEDISESEPISFTTQAVGDEGLITANGEFMLRNICSIRFEMTDSYGDGWDGNARISVRKDNVEIASVKLASGASGTETHLLPTGELKFYWIAGTYDSECRFKIYNSDDVMIYNQTNTPTAGLFLTYNNQCSQQTGGCEKITDFVITRNGNTVDLVWEGIAPSYLIKKDGLTLEQVTTTSYTDNNVSSLEHTYCVIAQYTDCNAFPVCDNAAIFVCEAPVNLTAVVENNTAVILTWEDAEGVEDVLGYNLFRNGEQINETLLTEKTYTDENLPVGTYTYQVNAEYGDCTSPFTDEESVTVYSCNPPENFEGYTLETVKSGTVKLTWTAPTYIDDELLGYNIYRDEEKINEDYITETEFIDYAVAYGTHYYQVSAVYAHCETLTESVEVVTFNSINDFQTTSFNLFPNPAHNELNLSGTVAPTNVYIYNSIGQLTYETNQCATNMRISVANLPAGMYFVKIVSERGSVTKRIVIVR